MGEIAYSVSRDDVTVVLPVLNEEEEVPIDYRKRLGHSKLSALVHGLVRSVGSRDSTTLEALERSTAE